MNRKKWGWELAGLDKATIDKFSRRTAQIEDEARKLGIVTPEGKSELGAKTRERKQKDLTLAELRHEWRSRLTDDEFRSVQALTDKIGGRPLSEDADAARKAIERSIEHVFERKSVVPERELLAQALKRSVGQASVTMVETAFHQHDLITAERLGRRMVTTPNIIAEEKRMISSRCFMTDSLLTKYIQRTPGDANDNSPLSDLEPLDDLGTFGWLRGVRDRAVMLELRKKDGNILAVGYT